ncbi:MAG: TIGR02588 family protein [Allorhizobium sp.]
MTRTKSGANTEGKDAHWIEWLTGVTSTVLVITLIGWIGFEAATRSPTPPQLSANVLATEKLATGYRVEFEVRNDANTTAAGVVVRGEIRENGNAVEDAEITFDYVPAKSQASGFLMFETDPTGRDMSIRPIGFTDP